MLPSGARTGQNHHRRVRSVGRRGHGHQLLVLLAVQPCTSVRFQEARRASDVETRRDRHLSVVLRQFVLALRAEESLLQSAIDQRTGHHRRQSREAAVDGQHATGRPGRPPEQSARDQGERHADHDLRHVF